MTVILLQTFWFEFEKNNTPYTHNVYICVGCAHKCNKNNKFENILLENVYVN